MYIDAMYQIQVNTSKIKAFITSIENGDSIEIALEKHKIDIAIADFIKFTFEVINSWKAHRIASAFTFGREDVIPDMFFEIIQQ